MRKGTEQLIGLWLKSNFESFLLSTTPLLYMSMLHCIVARKYYSGWTVVGWSAGRQPGVTGTKTISAQAGARTGAELGKNQNFLTYLILRGLKPDHLAQ